MLVVETIAKIRLAYFSRKMTIKAICRDLRVSRKVVRKVIRSQATEFHYQRDVQPQPKIGPWRERLDLLLLENDGKPARERLTLIRVFEELVGSAMRAVMTRFAATPGPGARSARARRRAPMCRCRLRRARPTSSIGVTRSLRWTG